MLLGVFRWAHLSSRAKPLSLAELSLTEIACLFEATELGLDVTGRKRCGKFRCC